MSRLQHTIWKRGKQAITTLLISANLCCACLLFLRGRASGSLPQHSSQDLGVAGNSTSQSNTSHFGEHSGVPEESVTSSDSKRPFPQEPPARKPFKERASSPAFRHEMHAAADIDINIRLGSFFLEAGIPISEISRLRPVFADALIEEKQGGRHISDSLFAGENALRIRDILGANYDNFKKYVDELPSRDVVTKLKNVLAVQGERIPRTDELMILHYVGGESQSSKLGEATVLDQLAMGRLRAKMAPDQYSYIEQMHTLEKSESALRDLLSTTAQELRKPRSTKIN